MSAHTAATIFYEDIIRDTHYDLDSITALTFIGDHIDYYVKNNFAR